MSLDALRGFDMFWIIGGDAIFSGLYKAMPNTISHFLDGQMRHTPWNGVTFYDLIFPLFVFIVGVSLVLSMSKTVEQHGAVVAIKRIFIRSLMLYLFGLLVYGGISKGWDQIRWVGVLQRIALCYLITGMLFCMFKLRGLIVICLSLLLGYWALMAFVPIRDFNIETTHLKSIGLTPESSETRTHFQSATGRIRGRFDEGLNVAQHFDFQYLPGYKWDHTSDPEGILGTFPSISECLFGVFAGFLLKNEKMPDQKKVFHLLVAGLAGVCLGFLWGTEFPVIKKIWTSSYVLIAGGYSCLLLAAFFQLVEIWQWRKWCAPFVWIGMNSIVIYLIAEILPLNQLAKRIVGGPIEQAVGNGEDLLVALVVSGCMVKLAHFLYTKRIFLRL